MNLGQAIAIAWQGVVDNRLRSVLTALGIVIGIASVITLTTLGAGVQASVTSQFATASTRSIDVTATPRNAGGPPGAFGGLSVFTDRDVAAIAALPDVEAVTPEATVTVAFVRVGERSLPLGSVTATTPDRAGFASMATGRAFAPNAAEAVLSDTAVNAFGEAVGVAVGDTLTLRTNAGDVAVTIVGVMAPEDGFPGSFTPNSGIFVPLGLLPLTTVPSPSGDGEVSAYAKLTVTAARADSVDAVRAAVRETLQSGDAQALLPSGYRFTLSSSAQILARVNEVLNLLTSFVTGIALISLLVGSIGIANIMLVSVSERTREIGIMKAIGAQRRTILSLFLIESVIHASIGSVIGTIVGLLGGMVGSRALDLTPTVPIFWVLAAIGIGVLVGILAGLYPASRAASLHPVQALRYE